jgi:hypothetical protein
VCRFFQQSFIRESMNSLLSLQNIDFPTDLETGFLQSKAPYQQLFTRSFFRIKWIKEFKVFLIPIPYP